jgi:hypothetical protein
MGTENTNHWVQVNASVGNHSLTFGATGDVFGGWYGLDYDNLHIEGSASNTAFSYTFTFLATVPLGSSFALSHSSASSAGHPYSGYVYGDALTGPAFEMSRVQVYAQMNVIGWSYTSGGGGGGSALLQLEDPEGLSLNMEPEPTPALIPATSLSSSMAPLARSSNPGDSLRRAEVEILRRVTMTEDARLLSPATKSSIGAAETEDAEEVSEDAAAVIASLRLA